MDHRFSGFVRRLSIILFWIILWQAAASLIRNHIFLVGPVDTLRALCEQILLPDFWSAIAFSFVRISIGFFLAFFLGLFTGSLAYRFPIVDEFLEPPVQLMKTVPVASFVILALICIKFYRAGNTVADFTAVALMALLVLSATSGGSYLTAVLDRIPVSGKYAYAMYCNHWTINYIIKEYFPGHSFYPTLAVYLCIVLALSVLTVFVIERAGAAIRRRTQRP